MKRLSILLYISMIIAVSSVSFVVYQTSTTSTDLDGPKATTSTETPTGKKDRKLTRILDKDAIPALTEPKFVPPDRSPFKREDKVIGVYLDGAAKAYPIRMLSWHNAVNDKVSDANVLISFCGLCGTGAVYSRDVAGHTLIFGISGMLYENNVVLYDEQTESNWIQMSGRSISGELKGAELVRIPHTETTLGLWLNLHPDSEVLSTDTGFEKPYNEDPYADYAASDQLGIGKQTLKDHRLKGKDLVIGVETIGARKAFPVEVLEERGFINDFLEGRPIVLFYDRETGTSKAYIRISGTNVLIFEPTSSEFILRDEELKSRWNMLTGAPADKSSRSKPLEELITYKAYWFAWSENYASSDLYSDEAEVVQ